MTTEVNRQILLVSRPAGEPKESDFDLVEKAIPVPGPNEVLCRTIYLSLDPYMRGRISKARSYAAGVEIGQTIVGGTVSVVQTSRNPKYKSIYVIYEKSCFYMRICEQTFSAGPSVYEFACPSVRACVCPSVRPSARLDMDF